MVGCLLAGLGLAIIFWSDWLLIIWISPQFSLAYSKVFEILILAYSLFSMVAPGYYIAFGLGHPEVPALVNLGGAILMVLLIALLSPALGLLGAALANFSYSLELAVIIFVAKKLEINILTAMRSLLPPIVILISIYMVHIFFANTIIYNIVITIILISLLTFLALNNGRLNIIINHLKTK